MPALIAAKACSSGIGVGLQVIIMRPCYEWTKAVSRYGGDQEYGQLTPTFATTTSPILAVVYIMMLLSSLQVLPV